MNKDWINDIQATSREFQAALAPFEQRAFNEVPFEGSWTPAQVAEHVLISESGLPLLLTGEMTTAGRDPQMFIPQIRTIFLDFTKKYKAAKNILPSDEPKDWKDMVGKLQDNRNRIEELVAGLNLDQICELAPFSGIGLLSGQEWICFMNCHARRHAYQLNNIRKIMDVV